MKTYNSIVQLLEQKDVPFAIIEHDPEGNTIKASNIRGHDLCSAAKSIVTFVERPHGEGIFVLAVVSGDRKVDMKSLARLFSGKKARFASASDAGRLTGCEMGAVPPISFHEALTTVFDERLTKEPKIVFNAGRLDLSIVVDTELLLSASMPRIGAICGELITVHATDDG